MDGRRVALISVRVGLPIVLAVAGVALLVIGHGRTAVAGTGVVVLGVSLMVVLVSWLARLGLSSNADRDREEAAREYFDRTGHWPDESQG